MSEQLLLQYTLICNFYSLSTQDVLRVTTSKILVKMFVVHVKSSLVTVFKPCATMLKSSTAFSAMHSSAAKRLVWFASDSAH